MQGGFCVGWPGLQPSVRHHQVVHRSSQCLGGSFRHPFHQDLIELPLENLFGLTTVDVSRPLFRLSKLFQKRAKQRLANKFIEQALIVSITIKTLTTQNICKGLTCVEYVISSIQTLIIIGFPVLVV